MPIIGPGGGSGTASPLTTKGDVWGFSSANARIPIGADTNVLTADSTQTLGLKWAAAAGASAITQLYDHTATTNDTSIDTGAAGVAGTANHLLIIVVSQHQAAEVVNFGALQFNNDTATNYGWNRFVNTNATGAGLATASDTQLKVLSSAGTTLANNFGTSVVFVANYANTTMLKGVFSLSQVGSIATVANMSIGMYQGLWNSTAAISRVKFNAAASTALNAPSRMTIYGLT